MLAVFEAKVQTKATFGDYAGLCSLWLRTSEDFQAMLSVCSETDAESIIKAQCETVLINLLKAALRNKTVGKALTASGQTVVEDVGTFAKFVLRDPGFGAKSLQPAVKLMHDVVACRSAEVKDLESTLEVLGGHLRGKFNKCEPGDLQEGIQRGGGVILEFLTSAGKAFHEEARCVLEDRAGERANEEKVDEMRLRSEGFEAQVEQGGFPHVAAYLDKWAAFLGEAASISKRKKKMEPSTQRS